MDGVGEQRGLIVAPREKPRPMQRYRYQQLGLHQQLGAGTRHPAAIGRRAVRPVAMLEGEHEAAAGIVIAENGAGASIRRRLGETGTALRIAAGIIRERQAATGTMRRREKGDAAPTARAELAVAADRRAAAEAARRQKQIEQAGGGTAQPASGKGEREHRQITARQRQLVNCRRWPGTAAVTI